MQLRAEDPAAEMTRPLSTAIVCALLLAACGSSGSSSPSASKQNSGLRFSQCMRAHGVSSFPDPTADGALQIGGTGINPRSPSFQAAQRSCQKLLPLKGAPAHMSAADRRAAVRFAECMRTHGVPDFPDPGQNAPRHASKVLVLRGMQFTPGPGLDPASPAFRQAAERCGIKLPTGPPQTIR